MKMKSTNSFMLVDDDDIFNMLHSELIVQTDPKAEIMEFISSTRALSFISRKIIASEPLPNFIFIDIRMPVLSGLELIAAFCKLGIEHFSSSSIYVITTSMDNRDRDSALEFPIVKDFVIKMISPEFIQQVINQKVSHFH